MGGSADLACGLTTTTGEVPFTEPCAAVDAALADGGALPTVPVLAGPATSMLAQAAQGLVGVEVDSGGRLEVCGADPAVGVIDVCDGAHEAFRVFLAAASAARPSSLRLGVLGPVSLARELCAAGVDRDAAIEVAAEATAGRSVMLLDAVRRAVPDAAVLVCASEPGLIGSVHPTFPFAPTEVLRLFAPFVAALDARADADLLIGVHVAGPTDWSTIVATGVSVISLPVDPSVAGWAPVLAEFLSRGGRIAWGAVPVDEPLGTSESLLWRRLSALWEELEADGVDPILLRSRSLVGPVDGLARFDPSQIHAVMTLVESLSERMRREDRVARVSVGA